jgi:hypothetical protein
MMQGVWKHLVSFLIFLNNTDTVAIQTLRWELHWSVKNKKTLYSIGSLKGRVKQNYELLNFSVGVVCPSVYRSCITDNS